ncbi:ubiquitin carboxyl-terminal hydrolase-related protein [Striga asiatica]|uniref:Ubiquitin carboxyl-terminal hydrolase-related protein n=1 Tax=Striga asiatica TaxID=4170 RepID=A0A5A7QKS8_STRAF|nr:ubiquitin carboxyl-terminal hydrolase-related protein [Striga asiatica]
MSTCSFEVDWARVEGERPTPSEGHRYVGRRQHPRHEPPNREAHDLHHNRVHGQAVLPEAEELVYVGQQHARHDSDDPCSEREGRQGWVVVRRHRQPHLLYRAVISPSTTTPGAVGQLASGQWSSTWRPHHSGPKISLDCSVKNSSSPRNPIPASSPAANTRHAAGNRQHEWHINEPQPFFVRVAAAEEVERDRCQQAEQEPPKTASHGQVHGLPSGRRDGSHTWSTVVRSHQAVKKHTEDATIVPTSCMHHVMTNIIYLTDEHGLGRDLHSLTKSSACDMLIKPYVLKVTFARGLPGEGVQKTHTMFVVACIMPMGKVKEKAIAQAITSPHQGSWSCPLKPTMLNIERQNTMTRSTWNHQSGTVS